jgi:hypothetical protein
LGGRGLGDAGCAFVALMCGHGGSSRLIGRLVMGVQIGCAEIAVISDIQAVEQRVGGVIDAGPPVCIYLVTAPLVAISTSAVA